MGEVYPASLWRVIARLCCRKGWLCSEKGVERRADDVRAKSQSSS
jgi:hypothetical protein